LKLQSNTIAHKASQMKALIKRHFQRIIHRKNKETNLSNKILRIKIILKPTFFLVKWKLEYFLIKMSLDALLKQVQILEMMNNQRKMDLQDVISFIK